MNSPGSEKERREKSGIGCGKLTTILFVLIVIIGRVAEKEELEIAGF